MSTQQIALVTGGTGGIGTAICQLLTNQGYRTIALSSSEEKAQRWQAEQSKAGFDIEARALNVADFSDCERLVLDIEEAVGPVSVLVNAAGITRDTPLKRMTCDQWQQVMNVNLNGTFNMCRNTLPFMLERGYGRIINISSINGEKGQFGQVNYATSKAGIFGLTQGERADDTGYGTHEQRRYCLVAYGPGREPHDDHRGSGTGPAPGP